MKKKTTTSHGWDWGSGIPEVEYDHQATRKDMYELACEFFNLRGTAPIDLSDDEVKLWFTSFKKRDKDSILNVHIENCVEKWDMDLLVDFLCFVFFSSPSIWKIKEKINNNQNLNHGMIKEENPQNPTSIDEAKKLLAAWAEHEKEAKYPNDFIQNLLNAQDLLSYELGRKEQEREQVIFLDYSLEKEVEILRKKGLIKPNIHIIFTHD